MVSLCPRENHCLSTDHSAICRQDSQWSKEPKYLQESKTNQPTATASAEKAQAAPNAAVNNISGAQQAPMGS